MKNITIDNDTDADIFACILDEIKIKYAKSIMDIERDINLGNITNKEFGKKVIKLNSNRINIVNNILNQIK
jgi:beta-lactamase regulating signal transducer with metallopeptidase domain